MTLSELLSANQDNLSDADLAVLADWASKRKLNTPYSDWKRGYALLREGADLLLRRRARSKLPGCEEVLSANKTLEGAGNGR